MTASDNISVTDLRRLVAYDPKTGVLTWKARSAYDFRCKAAHMGRVVNSWNSKYAGTQIASRSKDGRIVLHISLGLRFRTQGSRAAWAIHHGKWPAGVIDHIDGDCTNDRIDNLRDVTISENNRNQRISSRNTSGKVGVTFFKRTSQWRAWISINGRVKSLGYYQTKDEAVAARIQAEEKYGFFEATRTSEAMKYQEEFGPMEGAA